MKQIYKTNNHVSALKVVSNVYHIFIGYIIVKAKPR